MNVYCTNCGKKAQLQTKFCKNCGNKLGVSTNDNEIASNPKLTDRAIENGKTVVIINNQEGSLIGIASFTFGLLSIFFFSVVFVPLSFLMGIIGIFKGQFMWSILGFILAIIGFITSPMLLGIFGLLTLTSVQ
ncbi:hypothetical protein [Sulfurovum sp.]|uniref:hypothetical protein n=1 Tax=Sulfurovum sp. TaxID=1969726 RepID=UPI003569FF47